MPATAVGFLLTLHHPDLLIYLPLPQLSRMFVIIIVISRSCTVISLLKVIWLTVYPLNPIYNLNFPSSCDVIYSQIIEAIRIWTFWGVIILPTTGKKPRKNVISEKVLQRNSGVHLQLLKWIHFRVIPYGLLLNSLQSYSWWVTPF